MIEFKITIVNSLKILVEKVDSMHDQMGTFSRKVDNIKNPIEMLEMNNTVTDIKNALSGLISRLNAVEEKN